MLSTFWTHNLSLDNVSHLTFPWEKGLVEPQLLFLYFSWTEMDGEKPLEAAFIVYFSHDIDTWFVLSRYSVLQLESE